MEIKIIPVVNAVIIENNKILLGKRSLDKKFLPGYWTMPGGKVNPGEKLESAIKREVKEETGLKIKVLKLIRITEQFHDDHHHITFDFKVKPVEGRPKAGSDLIDVGWFEYKDIAKMKLSSENKKFLLSIKKFFK
jgi:8-oxo-dGTP diphosphatase